MKKCCSCKISKSFEKFSKNDKHKDELASHCKECHNLDYKKHNLKYRKLARARNKIMRELNNSFLREAKNNPCMDCGNSYPFWVMDFDHRDKTNKFAEINKMKSSYRLEKIKKEVEKCDLVCANCHRMRTHNRYKKSWDA